MSWENWPYWLRGGVIGGGVTSVFVMLFYACVWTTTPGGFLCLPLLFVSPMFPFIDLFDTNPYFHALPRFSMEIMSIAAWFLIGSLIGLLVGHIRKGRIQLIK